MRFTITKGNKRQDCILRTATQSNAYALTYLKNHRFKIEGIAQQRWADLIIEDGIVYVDLG